MLPGALLADSLAFGAGSDYITREPGPASILLTPLESGSPESYATDLAPNQVHTAILLGSAGSGKTQSFSLVVFDQNGSRVDATVNTSRTVDAAEVPAEYQLETNYPNPFNPSTQIRYGLPVTSRVSIRIFDATGRIVRNLVDRQDAAGTYTVTWNGETDSGVSLASGLYFYRLVAGDYAATRGMVLAR